MLEVENRVRILDRREEEALRVGGRRRAGDLQARDVREARLGVLRVERPAGEAAAGRQPDDDRHGGSRPVVLLGRHGDEVIPGAGDEVGELHLRHGAHAHDRGARAAADDRGLGQRRVDHPPRAELLLEALGDLERAAVDADVLADHEDPLVAAHLVAKRVRDRLEIRLDGHGSYLW